MNRLTKVFFAALSVSAVMAGNLAPFAPEAQAAGWQDLMQSIYPNMQWGGQPVQSAPATGQPVMPGMVPFPYATQPAPTVPAEPATTIPSLIPEMPAAAPAAPVSTPDPTPEPAAVAEVGIDATPYTVDQRNKIVTVSPNVKDVTGAVNSALAYLINRPDKNVRWTLKFLPGKYVLTKHMYADKLENVSLVSDRTNPAVMIKSPTAQGEYLYYSRFSKNVSLTGFKFYGKTDFKNSLDPVWPDQGLYFGSCNGITLDRNNFYNFGNAALRVTTTESDPVRGVNSFNTTVTNNYFNNVYQISTTSNDEIHGATANYVFQSNTVNNLRGSVKFASRTAGARNVKVLGNVISGGDHYGLEIDNYSDFEISGNRIENIKEYAINVYTNPRAPKGFVWGNNFFIKSNTISNVGRGIRFSPEPYADGYTFVPTNVAIENNVLSGVRDGNTSIPAISIINGKVNTLRIVGNKMTGVASRNYIRIVPGSTGVTLAGNYAENTLLALKY
jgi:hypothetical protein